jgi:hypothetical protein
VLAHDVSASSDALPAELREPVLRSLHPATSGDIFVVTAPYVVPELGGSPGVGTTHGSPWPYDAHVPGLLLAPGVQPARHDQTLDVTRVASTLAALLGVPPPRTATPTPLPGVTAR